MNHPPAEYLVRLAEGLLPVDRIPATLRHLDRCPECQASFAIIVGLKLAWEVEQEQKREAVQRQPRWRTMVPALVRRARIALGAG